jgi:hypothetical protein|tara:strand:+ start:2091 stop:2207 length:117 start_codon:yes stop_codon:yes gene_type:complete
MPRFTLRQEIAAGIAAMFCSAIFVISSVGPATNGATLI